MNIKPLRWLSCRGFPFLWYPIDNRLILCYNIYRYLTNLKRRKGNARSGIDAIAYADVLGGAE